jgi:hypothetical protein
MQTDVLCVDFCNQVLPTIQKKIDVLVAKFAKAADEGKQIEVSE